MVRHRFVWVEILLVLALTVFGILHAREVEQFEPVYRVLLTVALFYLFNLLSPVQITVGKRSLEYDVAIVAAFLLIAGGNAFPFVNPFTESTVILVGFLLLGILSLMISYALPPSQYGALHILGKQHHAKRAFSLFLLLVLFYLVVFQPVTRLLLSLSSIVWLRPIVSVLVLIGLLQERRFIRSHVLMKLGTLCSKVVHDFAMLFSKRRTFLLGITGILILHFTIRVGGGLVPALLDAMRLSPSLVTAIAVILSVIGTVVLFFLPPYMWWTTVKVRKSHDHLPDWPRWLVSVSMAGIVAALVFPVISLQAAFAGASVIVSLPSSHPYLALVSAALVFFISLGVTSLDDYLRRILMTGPMLAGIVFFGIYVYESFVSTFTLALGQLISYVSGFALLSFPLVLLLFSMEVIFFVAGYLSFLYELWRE